MIDLTKDELDKLYEGAKNDRFIVVASEVRQMVGMIRRANDRIEQLKAALDRAVTRGLDQVERVEQLEAALWVFTGVLRTPSSYINDAYELHVKRVEYEKACAALAPEQDK